MLLWKSSKYYRFWLCVCSLSHPACKAHLPYYIVICGMSSSMIFFLDITCGFDFLYSLFLKIFLTLRRIQWDIIININTSSSKVPVTLVRFEWNLNFLNRFLKIIQISNFIKLHQVRLSCPMWTDGLTDRHDKDNSHFSRFCKST